MKNKEYERRYTRILRDELQVALGCTEPITIAFAAAYARKMLGDIPERLEVFCSGNMIKNVKAVTVPETDGKKGIKAAALIGVVGGNCEKNMEVLADVTEEDKERFEKLYHKECVTIHLLDTEHILHVIVKAYLRQEEVSVEVIDSHTGLGEVIKNGKICHKRKAEEEKEVSREFMNVRDIVEYADTVPLSDVKDILLRQIECNSGIAREGMENKWGAQIGKLSKEMNYFQYAQICAGAAAGSDARMNGCTLPVVINSGSGNQGITASVPVISYARSRQIPEEKLFRALCISNLITIHQKTGIGKLSAFCGVVSAAAGAACAVAYMEDEPVEVLMEIISNTICTCGGILCDGAKSSCAAKIATALYSAFLGYEQAKNKSSFAYGEGIVQEDIEKTIACIGEIASHGMRSTDREILNVMLE